MLWCTFVTDMNLVTLKKKYILDRSRGETAEWGVIRWRGDGGAVNETGVIDGDRLLDEQAGRQMQRDGDP